MSINFDFSVEVNEKMNVKMSDRALSNCWLSFVVLIYLLGCIRSVSARGLFRCGARTLLLRCPGWLSAACGLSCSEAGACGILVPQPEIRPMSQYCKVNS